MRFEMSSKDVYALCGLIDIVFDEIDNIIDDHNGLYVDGLITNCKTIIKKIKMYGEKGFETRDEFREAMKEYKERLDDYEKRKKQ